ncbi:MAG: uridine kinase [Legionellales bacterium]|nr:uridine kinase [Legionellales bacterium]
MIFVFIGGASGSGKTTLSKTLLAKLHHLGISAQMLNMDDYFHERPDGIEPEAYRLFTNFDTPDMLHLELMSEHLIELNKGNPITKPIFVFSTNRRTGSETIHPSEVILVEGIFSQYFYKNFLHLDLMSMSVNVATDDYLDIVGRRFKRDKLLRGRTEKALVEQERQFVGPGFLKFTASSTLGSDVYVLNEREMDEAEQRTVLDTKADEIILELNRKLSGARAGDLSPKTRALEVQEMVARSHLIADTLFTPRKFEGYFHGAFGYKGPYVRAFSPEEEAAMRLANREDHRVIAPSK